MDEELKRKAYLEGSRLKNQGLEGEIIYARLEKQGIPEELAAEVVKNIFVQQQIDTEKNVQESHKVNFNVGISVIIFGVVLAIISAIILPEGIIIPIGFIVGGVIKLIKSNNKKG